MIPTEAGYYWATGPNGKPVRSDRRIIQLVHNGVMWIVYVAGYCPSMPAEWWTDWHGPIVEECEACGGQRQESLDMRFICSNCGILYYTTNPRLEGDRCCDCGFEIVTRTFCPACGGEGRRKT